MKNATLCALSAAMLTAGCDPSSPAAVPSATPSDAMTGAEGTGPSASASAAPSSSADAGSADAASSGPKSDPSIPAQAAKDSAGASNAFGFALHKLLPKKGNLAYSPASISIALSMTYAGAEGDTERQMAETMRFPADEEALHGGWQRTLSAWKAVDKVELAVANRLYGAKQIAFDKGFVALTGDRYGAPLVAADFAADPEAERTRINDWVLKQTKDRIRDLIPGGGISKDTRLALVNAMYFKASWVDPFEKEQTSAAAFEAPSGPMQVEMMSSTDSMGYAAIDGVTIAERPYVGGKFAAVFVLPPEGTDIGAFEAKLSDTAYRAWVDGISVKTVSLSLPRFKIDPADTMEITDQLQKLGMVDAFDAARADFTAMTEKPEDRPAFDKVYHKAFVAMDEAGTEAAAATAVVMGPGGAPPSDIVEVRLDRPFLFFIHDLDTGLVLFAGRVVEPEKAG